MLGRSPENPATIEIPKVSHKEAQDWVLERFEHKVDDKPARGKEEVIAFSVGAHFKGCGLLSCRVVAMAHHIRYSEDAHSNLAKVQGLDYQGLELNKLTVKALIEGFRSLEQE